MIPNLKLLTKYLFLSIFFLSFLGACRNHEFKIKGEIYGGEDKTIVLEKSDFQGRWIDVDSTNINRNGGFSLSFPAPLSPEIYRLALNGQYIYIPVDSTETITISTSFNNFGYDFSLTGSKNAELLEKFEKELHQINLTEPDSVSSFKRNVFSTYMKDNPGSILNFYILTKVIDKEPLYNPAKNEDRKYFAAVATGYKAVRPEDPHTRLLENTALQAMRQKNANEGKYQTYEAEEIALIDIDLPDENGKNIKLSEVTTSGKPTVVIFSLLNQPESPEFNIALANLYKKLSGRAEFYNVSLDNDQYEWREAAKNLPWITVYSPGGSISEAAINYNITQLPAFFIYNSEGELTGHPADLVELENSL